MDYSKKRKQMQIINVIIYLKSLMKVLLIRIPEKLPNRLTIILLILAATLAWSRVSKLAILFLCNTSQQVTAVMLITLDPFCIMWQKLLNI